MVTTVNEVDLRGELLYFSKGRVGLFEERETEAPIEIVVVAAR